MKTEISFLLRGVILISCGSRGSRVTLKRNLYAASEYKSVVRKNPAK